MNIGQIKTKIANLLGKAVADLVINDDDMILAALNNAKQLALQAHDFESLKRLVQLTISTPQGASLDDCVEYPVAEPEVPVDVKSVVNVSILGLDGVSMFPIDFRRRDSLMAELRKDTRTESIFWDSRYPISNCERLSWWSRSIREVTQYNRTIQLRPLLQESSGDVILVMEAYVGQSEYSEDEDEDYFTTKGFNYLIYQSIVELNLFLKVWVPRQESTLSPPEKQAAQYLQALITDDIYTVAGNMDVDAN